MTSRPTTRPGIPWRTALLGALLIILLPWIFALLDSRGEGVSWALVQLVLINPLVFAVGSLRSLIRYGWKTLITLAAYSAAFLISVFTVYNSSALVYLAGYLIVVVGVFALYWLIRTLRNRKSSSGKIPGSL